MVDIANNEQIVNFQVGYMSYPSMNQNEVFKYQVAKNELKHLWWENDWVVQEYSCNYPRTQYWWIQRLKTNNNDKYRKQIVHQQGNLQTFSSKEYNIEQGRTKK